ncbi:glycosyltransferase family 2 protein [Allokutzneria sp. NRRL B-24872]|uniref:glycosyltransferase n=1 Tax=Allokutzneria sp. NRRL B-24872 TaxID=1137961 RepID=UPI000A376066|nr:glycosyltransferase [Allokutzneria sp. NRRL B-24872]
MITAIGVVIPARDEAGLIGACLHAMSAALRGVPPRVERVVCVVADRCTDETVRLARAAFGGWQAGVITVNDAPLSIGEVRALGCRAARWRLRTHAPSTTLLLNTDADSAVGRSWAREHLRLADEGSHAVAGTAEFASPFPVASVATLRYQRVLDRARRPEGHGNVYGANLGVRADAYAAVGGFHALSTGEDHDLWDRLGVAGFRLRYDCAARVRTSARLAGRAPHGLAELLRTLVGEQPEAVPRGVPPGSVLARR